nr:hypothetical protein [Saccharopolyspora gloriosae]
MRAEPGGGGHADIVEVEIAERESTQTEAGLVGPNSESGAAGIDAEHAEFVLAGAGDYRMDVGDVRVADEAFSSVDEVILAISDGGGVHFEHVSAGMGFGHRDRGEYAPVRQGGKPALLLFSGGDPPEYRYGNVAGLRGGADRSGDAGEPFDDDHFGAMVHPLSAVGGGNGRTEPAEPSDLSHQIVVGLPRRFQLWDSRSDVPVGEFGDRLGERVMVVRQQVAVDLIVTVMASSVEHQHSLARPRL